jgi:hypothetical protein
VFLDLMEKPLNMHSSLLGSLSVRITDTYHTGGVVFEDNRGSLMSTHLPIARIVQLEEILSLPRILTMIGDDIPRFPSTDTYRSRKSAQCMEYLYLTCNDVLDSYSQTVC